MSVAVLAQGMRWRWQGFRPSGRAIECLHCSASIYSFAPEPLLECPECFSDLPSRREQLRARDASNRDDSKKADQPRIVRKRDHSKEQAEKKFKKEIDEAKKVLDDQRQGAASKRAQEAEKDPKWYEAADELTRVLHLTS